MPDDFPAMATSEEEFSSFGVMYKGLRPLFYAEREKEDCRKLQAMVKNGELFRLFKAQNIPDTQDSRLELICNIIHTRAAMILEDLSKSSLKPSSVFNKG
jgi:hypothetical protein